MPLGLSWLADRVRVLKREEGWPEEEGIPIEKLDTDPEADGGGVSRAEKCGGVAGVEYWENGGECSIEDGGVRGNTIEENGEKASKTAPANWHCRDRKLEQSVDTNCNQQNVQINFQKNLMNNSR